MLGVYYHIPVSSVCAKLSFSGEDRQQEDFLKRSNRLWLI